MESLHLLLSSIAASTVLAAAPASATSPANAPAIHFAGMLANDARDLLRNPALPPDAAAIQATVLLQFACKLDPTNLRTLKMLAQTARATGKTDIQKDSLHKVIAADPGDLVAQMQYIDLIAGSSQTMEDRANVYKNVLGDASFDKQVRSESAVRLARLAEGRGDMAQARDFLNQALKFNDVNVGAARERMSGWFPRMPPAIPPRRSRRSSRFSSPIPIKPMRGSKSRDSVKPPVSTIVPPNFSTPPPNSSAPTGWRSPATYTLNRPLKTPARAQRRERYDTLLSLTQFPDAPLSTFLVTELLSQPLPPRHRPAPTPDSCARVRPRGPQSSASRKFASALAELAKQIDGPTALADAAGADLTILSTPGPDTASWIDAYEKMVAPEDMTLARPARLAPLPAKENSTKHARGGRKPHGDPLSRLGIARILLDQEQARSVRRRPVAFCRISGPPTLRVCSPFKSP